MSEVNSEQFDLAHLAKLARIDFSQEELDTLRPQLLAILEYVARIGEVATPDVEPMSHVFKLENVVRSDEVTPGLSTEDALAGAPEQRAGRFAVPPSIAGCLAGSQASTLVGGLACRLGLQCGRLCPLADWLDGRAGGWTQPGNRQAADAA